MPESQTIEYKSTRRDEYQKWICGFANANGGTLFIGKDDNGQSIGVNNAKKLMEDIPNKIKASMGIVADIRMRNEKQREYLEIIVTAYSTPISYHGKYYYRSGSTLQELTASALDKFLLSKQGRKWDSIPVPNTKVSDLKQETIEFFRKL
jgi:ATP-dependent DNA helicase RecG